MKMSNSTMKPSQMTPRRWAESNIAKRLWDHGQLLPPLKREAEEYLSREPRTSFLHLQQKLGLPIRLASYLSLNCKLEAHYTSRNLRFPSRAEILSRKILGAELYNNALLNVKRAATMRSEPALIYGQRFITPESSVCRAALISSVISKRPNVRIVFLGDDDLASVAAATILKNASITVIEIDKTLLKVFQDINAELNLKMNLEGHDLSQPLPHYLKQRFDCFVGDPYPTPDGSFEMWFVKCGVELLEQPSQGLGVVTFAPTHKFPGFRNVLLKRLDQDFVVNQVVEGVCDYEMITGELTPLEYDYLGRVTDESLISHSKSCLIITTKPTVRTVNEKHLRLDLWLASTRSHELALRLGGEHRLEAELDRTIDQEIWSSAYHSEPRASVQLDMRQILCDLIGNEDIAVRLNNLASSGKPGDFGRALGEATSSGEIGDEAGCLLDAASSGSVTVHDTYSLEFELYLLTRIYESYYRGSNPLRAQGV